jgi:hypothetical protein
MTVRALFAALLAIALGLSGGLTQSCSAARAGNLVLSESTTPTEGSTPAETFVGIAPSLRPSLLGAKGELAFDIHFTGGEFGVPPPVRRAVLKFPAGMGIEIPVLRSCSVAHLRSRGPSGCPVQSEIGRGSVLVEAHLGSQVLLESVALRMFIGPLRNLQPTVEILGQGYTPFEERLVFGGAALAAEAPYGEELVLQIPPIATLPLEPDASIVSLSLTLGSDGTSRAHEANTVIVPASCPPSGFPFAAEFTYADGTSTSAQATDACPR